MERTTMANAHNEDQSGIRRSDSKGAGTKGTPLLVGKAIHSFEEAEPFDDHFFITSYKKSDSSLIQYNSKIYCTILRKPYRCHSVL